MGRLADLICRRARWIVAAGFCFAAVAFAFGAGVADHLRPYEARDPASPSAKAAARIEAETGVSARPTSGLVVLDRMQVPIRSPAGRRALARVVGLLRSDPDVASVRTAFAGGSAAQISADGEATFIAVGYRRGSTPEHVFKRLQKRLSGVPGVELTGPSAVAASLNSVVQDDLRRAELIVFPLLALLSFWLFRSVVAAMLPLLMAGFSIAFSFCGLLIINSQLGLSVYALNLVNALALGLGIDYSLLMVSRYREEILVHGPGAEALRRTLSTAGRAVAFSSLTVAAALAALLLFPQNFVYSNGIGGVLVALVSGGVALTVLPALLALLGSRVNALAPKRLKRAARWEARGVESGPWYRLSRFIMRRPVPVAFASAAVLIVLGLPILGVRFTSLDGAVLPANEQARVAEEQIKREFPAASTSPIIVAAEGSPKQVARLSHEVRALPGVSGVAAPQFSARRFAVLDVATREPWLSQRSQQLVRDIRTLDPGRYVGTAGQTADFVDLKVSLVDHIPGVIALLATTTLLIMFMLTGSVVLPLKALTMNVLTLSATLGILVLVFQNGHLEGLLSYTSQGALESSFPIVVFATVFGISTDYTVFLLSRIKEAREDGLNDREAVGFGLQRTGRLLTAAALLLCVAVGALVLSRIVMIKEIGMGIALAVLLDATIVRALLVPSLMALLGYRNWWAPPALRRFSL